ncbi:MAG: hypothetical protein HFH62_04450 [Lachnospiraceae bacterium]|nr:hypothetical protein [Lachnospiraceae bacterium]
MTFDGVYEQCGHEGSVSITGGKSAEKEEKAKWYFSGLCPECYKKKKEEERIQRNADAAKEAEELELPELTGTPKQVAWANTLRLNMYKVMSERIGLCIKRLQENGSEECTPQELAMAFDWFMQEKTEARFWIDRREKGIKPIEIIREFRIYTDEKENMEAEAGEEVAEEVTVRPEEAVKDGVAKIHATEEKVSAHYIKDEDFIAVVKGLGYRWNGGAWQKEITEYTGTAPDRAAELGNALLAAGFTVQFPNREISDRAVSGDVPQENDRWVKCDPEGESLLLAWKKRSDDLYQAAKKLPGARWRDGAMRVKAEYYRDVEDFADTMGFNISEAARKAIARQQEKEGGYVAVRVEAPGGGITDRERLEKSLKAGGVILDDLKDD